ncbi:MAG TPA: hypothetical protein ENO30_02095 [Thermodesulfobium narugense]|nr:hypothetical protein [Thermodesulfobium narugense]
MKLRERRDRIIRKITALRPYGTPDVVDGKYAMVVEGKILKENDYITKVLIKIPLSPYKSILVYKPELKEFWLSKETMEVIPAGENKLIIKKK